MRAPLSPYGSTPAELRERLALERNGTAFLAWRDVAGHQCLAALHPERPRCTIGRGHDNDVALPWDSRASRVHAIVERAGGEWLVVDDGLSQNGPGSMGRASPATAASATATSCASARR
jgi:hypothetical protein